MGLDRSQQDPVSRFTTLTQSNPYETEMEGLRVLPTNGFDEIRAIADADPELKDRVRLVQIDPKKDTLGAFDQVDHALDSMEKSRFLNGKSEVGLDQYSDLLDTAMMTQTEPGFAVRVGKESSGKDIAFAIVNKDSSFDQMTAGHPAQLTPEFMAALKEADGKGVAIPLHELGHTINGMYNSDDDHAHGEKMGDAMNLWRVAQNEPDMDAKLLTIAQMRDISPDSDHLPAADVLLRMRQELKENPAEIHKLIDGKTPSEISRIAEERYVRPSDAAMGTRAEMDKVTAYAQNQLYGDTNAPIPTDLTRAEAVTLIRMQNAYEKTSTNGENNWLSAKMPEIEARNPKAFKEAEQYMQDTYGMDRYGLDIAPKAAPAVSAGPAAPAVTRQQPKM